jgi:glycosyltransferase involved in cell wall biosynthesis
MTRPVVSVVVCTYNRAGALAACLNSLGEANLRGGGERELLIVDNNSTDRTRDVVHEFAKSASIRVQYIFEPEQGSSAARNRGLAATRGDLIAITDDDCIVDASWFQEIEKAFSDVAVDMVGGRVELYDKQDRPISIRTSRVPAKLTEAWQTFYIAQGCNIVFRRSVHERIGSFDKRLGPGTRARAAEDSDFIYRIFCAGFTILYNPEVLVFHNHGRRTHEQEQSLAFAYLRGRGAWYAKHLLQGDRQVLKMLVWDFAKEVEHAFLKAVQGRSARSELWYLRELVFGLFVGFTIFFSPRGGP